MPSVSEKIVAKLRAWYVPLITLVAVGCGYVGSLVDDWRLRAVYLVPVVLLIFYLLHRMAPPQVVDTRRERMERDRAGNAAEDGEDAGGRG